MPSLSREKLSLGLMRAYVSHISDFFFLTRDFFRSSAKTSHNSSASRISHDLSKRERNSLCSSFRFVHTYDVVKAMGLHVSVLARNQYDIFPPHFRVLISSSLVTYGLRHMRVACVFHYRKWGPQGPRERNPNMQVKSLVCFLVSQLGTVASPIVQNDESIDRS